MAISSRRIVAWMWITVSGLTLAAIAQPTVPKKAPAAPTAVKPAPAAKTVPATTTPASKPAPMVAYIRLAGNVPDSPPGFSLFSSSYMTLRDWLERLADARTNESLAAVALEIDSPRLNWAHAQELADAIRRLDAVKPVYTYITSGGAAEYLVASAGRNVTMEPTGSLSVTGLSSEMLFFRGTLDWLGVKAQMIQIGKFKGAAEPFTRTAPSEELVAEYDKILDDLYEQLCEQVAQQRKLTIPHVKFVIDEAPLNGPAAQREKFVDNLSGKLEWRDYVAKNVAPKDSAVTWKDDYGAKPKQSLDLGNPLSLLGMLMGKGGGESIKDPTIALIHADGVIVTGSGGDSLFGGHMVGSRTLVEAFEEVRKDDRVKAVIFRIDSPGGSALASEQIYQAARKCASKKPVIASISGLGASGGYYIAVGADKILADPSALVGSIGVVSGKLALTGLMEKLNIGHHEMSRGKNAGLFLSRPWDAREEELVRKDAKDIYDVFVRRVSEGRAGKVKDISQVAEGRIFTARQAAGNGLVDKVGGLRDAILAAQEAAGLKTFHFITLPKPKTIIDMLTGNNDDDGAEGRLAGLEAPQLMALRKLLQRSRGLSYMMTLAEMIGSETCLTAMPYYVEVKP